MWRTGQSRKTERTKDIDLTWFREHSAVCMTALSFLLPVFVMLVSYNASGIRPFGDEEFSYMDYHHLYLPFFTEFVRNIREGRGFFYSWNAGLGTNLYVLYATNLSSPFHLLGLLVPEAYLGDFLAYLVVFKAGLGGLCAYCFLEARRKRMAQGEISGGKAEGVALFFSLGYAMSGFLMAYNWNIMWLDCVVLLPLILLGLERLVFAGRPFLYCVTLAASIWCNFYLSIMVCIFLVLYFGYLFLAGGLKGRLRWKRAGEFAVFSLLAGGSVAALLLPAVLTLATSDFGAGQSVNAGGDYFALWKSLFRHSMAVKAVALDSHWPNVYCGVSAFLLVPLFAVNGRIPVRRRLGLLGLFVFLLYSFANPVLDLFWHGMNYPDGLPARQSFVYIMLVIVICHECVLHMGFAESGRWKRVTGIYVVVMAFILFGGGFAEKDGFMRSSLLLTVVFVTVYAVLLVLAYLITDGRKRGYLLLCAVAAMVLEIQINAVETNVLSAMWGGHLDQTACRELGKQVAGEEEGIFRIEMFTREIFNEGVRDDYPSASLFTSVQNSRVRALYEQMGMRQGKMFYGFDGNTPLVAALLNVKYMFGGTGYANALYAFDRQAGEVQLYRAKTYLPFGYVAPVGFDLEGEQNSLELQNELTRKLGCEGDLFEHCDAAESEEGITFRVPEAGVYYAVLTAENIRKVSLVGVNAYGMGGNTTYLDQNSVICLGELSAGQQGGIANADIAMPGADVKKVTAEVYRLQPEVLKQAMAALSRQHLENVTYDNTHINGSLRLEQAGRLILSVPYEKGWKICLNGERVEPATFGGALIALDLQPGEYELSMRYVPYGLEAGILTSIVSIMVIAGLYLFYGRRRKTGNGGSERNIFSELSNKSMKK